MGARALGFVSLTVWLFVERLSHWDRFVYRRQHDGAADARFYFFFFSLFDNRKYEKIGFHIGREEK
jgi:hypothetical protein